ncbi:NAD(P)/FAD-dependent oxidoreductase [Calidifontibacter sp. DB0510]|uniref:NAD(P)/FAD-dependent oxidoreductase n=1 Tax=Metallococcus carri TaxID=1656884 RepID=A0A967AYN8_9MICO|nr:FAD/NAD(P)-binding oxidoreductase [Metallococcus carri]NHN54849.1 NAD(P)/FAD-dependent oxidoreductase [Metallococcus carri]NOP37194.1 NAD(P)/FAD-dependent oxidoreductase [Calidifontibacter sp. DB2511S]
MVRRYALVVVGSGPAGVAAAAAYRRAGGDGPVLLVSADPDPPYQRPPLTKATLRADAAPTPTPLDEADDLGDTEVELATAATGLDPQERTIRLGDEEVGFDRLVLAPGSVPVELPGVDPDAEVHYLRRFADLQALDRAVRRSRDAVVIGSGFIGSEAAASLTQRGLSVTMVSAEDAPQRGRLGERAAQLLTDLLTGYGVELRSGVKVQSIEAPRTIHLDDGHTLHPDLILIAAGVRPATDFITEAGLPLHEGRIVVDDHLQTPVEGIFAAGDAARGQHAIAGRPINVEHWGDALAMGEVAGRGAAQADATWREVPGFWSEIGEHQIQYAAWGDGYDRTEVSEGPGALTIRYFQDDELVGVFAYNAEQDYQAGREQLAAEEPDEEEN